MQRIIEFTASLLNDIEKKNQIASTAINFTCIVHLHRHLRNWLSRHRFGRAYIAIQDMFCIQ